MKYVDRDNWIEHYPENERDLKFLREQYGAKGLFECWCVAKKPKETSEDFAARHWAYVSRGWHKPPNAI